MQSPSELDFWSEYKLRMSPLEKSHGCGAEVVTNAFTKDGR